CDGAPPFRQAFSLMMYSSSGLTWPCLISLNRNSSVISLARLAGATRWSPFLSYKILSLSASTRIAAGTLLWNPSSFLPEPTDAAPAAISSANSTATQPKAVSARTIAQFRFLSLVVDNSSHRRLREYPNYCRAKIRRETDPSPATLRPQCKARDPYAPDWTDVR